MRKNAIDEEFFDEVVCEVEDLKPKHVLSLGARCVLTFGGALSNMRNVCAKSFIFTGSTGKFSVSEEVPTGSQVNNQTKHL